MAAWWARCRTRHPEMMWGVTTLHDVYETNDAVLEGFFSFFFLPSHVLFPFPTPNFAAFRIFSESPELAGMELGGGGHRHRQGKARGLPTAMLSCERPLCGLLGDGGWQSR